VVTSPNYPSNYLSNQSCKYRISAPEDRDVVIEIEDLVTKYDYLRIYNGPTNRSRSIDNITGTLYGVRRLKTSNEVFLRFDSDNLENRRGFKLNYRFKPRGLC